MTIFSVEDVNLWNTMAWPSVLMPLILVAATIFFPELIRRPLLKSGLGAAIPERFQKPAARFIVAGLYLLILIPHILMTSSDISAAKSRFLAGDFETLELPYDGELPARKFGGREFPDTGLNFGGTAFHPVGGLHGGFSVTPSIRKSLTVGETYELAVADGTILRIRSVE